MKKICVITGSRAEYGLLSSLMKAIKNNDAFELQILVTGMHLLPQFGNTFNEIEKDGFNISEKVDIELNDDTSLGIAKSVGIGIIKISEALEKLKPDLFIVLGDRFEAFAGALAAFLLKIPIAHISGGDVTEGAMDDAFRHSITKMAYLHFTSTEVYKNRVIQLGEAPERVFNVGSTGIDNVLNMSLISINQLGKSLEINLTTPYFLITFHPVTLENETSKSQFSKLIEALDFFSNYQIVFTYPNADADGQVIIEMIKDYEIKNPNRVKAFKNLGTLRYLSAIKYSKAVIGNSSSGIIEVPSFGIPTVNIGNRQKGRIKAGSVIDCDTEIESIKNAITKAVSLQFQEYSKKVENIYGNGTAISQIMEVLSNFNFNGIRTKYFYDIPTTKIEKGKKKWINTNFLSS